MVGGLNTFREAFRRFTDNFVIIGGTACDEVLSRDYLHPTLIYLSHTPSFYRHLHRHLHRHFTDTSLSTL